ncbi:MAG: hypothetical protein IPO72_10460 [Saprospiraceae bacterium]|nr:hypothetical protein [Candidatus Vicinibacter affinis]MBK9641682.1 hypothetical protein [Candidatus Vicinibacter affinis]
MVTNYAQVKVNGISSVGIGTDTITPSAKLEVHSTNKGFLKPRMDTAARKAIANKVPGLKFMTLILRRHSGGMVQTGFPVEMI